MIEIINMIEEQKIEMKQMKDHTRKILKKKKILMEIIKIVKKKK